MKVGTEEREEVRETVVRLRSEGRTAREIAEQVGLSRSTVATIWNDPDGSKAKARKESYRGSCNQCGGPTDGGNGKNNTPSRCKWCVMGLPMNDRRRPHQPSLRRCHPVRLCDLPLDVRVAAARAAIRLEKFDEQKHDLIYAAMFPSEDTYWVAESAEPIIEQFMEREAA